MAEDRSMKTEEAQQPGSPQAATNDPIQLDLNNIEDMFKLYDVR